jgi:hypothetical protein
VSAKKRESPRRQEWHCHICGKNGVGGKGGWQHHYISDHWREAQAAGYRKRDER